MTTPSRRCRRLLPAAVLLLAATAPARSETFDAGTVWKGNIVRDGNGRLESCAVMRDFDNDSVLTFALTRDRDFFLLVSNPRVRPPGGMAGIRYMVDDGAAYRAPAEVMQKSVVVDLPDGSALQELLGNGTWLYFNELGDIGYSLKGAKESLRALAGCVERGLAAEGDPAGAAPPSTSAPVAVAVGGAAADLGVYDTEERARVDWLHMKKVLGELLDGREPQFATRTRGKDGRAFTVLRIPGFADRDAAARFCQAMQAKKRECVVR